MARTSGFSKKKYEEKILNELNSILRTQVSDPRTQFVSLTNIDLNKDYSIAKVYWDTFNSNKRGECKDAIEKMAGILRTKLAKAIKLKHVPELKFFYDSQFEDEAHITQILKSETERE